ncbi:WYL domain-containing protein [Variovorax saccharolyticus]|uniref:WYL domain-containing protein n=1 Tax=Variovorax saccharolyticus TaxID=3053516 RepID=UPI002578C382|nr:WYL domain-containing protein [Variovorax sp. J31P216]MDM0025772.1 WYL domain-containing protein [Variovorax sp. J31P216]
MPPIPRAQLERLSYIDFRLYFLGQLRRSDLVARFGTGPAGATRDIAQYREAAPGNLEFDGTRKLYLPSASFKPLFEHAPQRVLSALSQGFGQGAAEDLSPLLRCEIPSALSVPRMSVLAPVTRAIHCGKALRLVYHSLSGEPGERELVPFALVDSGVRWHVRAFDRKSAEFRDFVLTRIESPVVLEHGEVGRHETAEHDVQWSRIVELELVPHPSHPRPDVIRLDYDMPDGVLRIKVRAANAGYMLRRWNVDCSPGLRLRGPEYALGLADPLVLYGAANALLAPGYRPPVAAASADKLQGSRQRDDTPESSR